MLGTKKTPLSPYELHNKLQKDFATKPDDKKTDDAANSKAKPTKAPVIPSFKKAPGFIELQKLAQDPKNLAAKLAMALALIILGMKKSGALTAEERAERALVLTYLSECTSDQNFADRDIALFYQGTCNLRGFHTPGQEKTSRNVNQCTIDAMRFFHKALFTPGSSKPPYLQYLDGSKIDSHTMVIEAVLLEVLKKKAFTSKTPVSLPDQLLLVLTTAYEYLANKQANQKSNADEAKTDSTLDKQLADAAAELEFPEGFYKSVCQLHGWREPMMPVEEFVAKTAKTWNDDPRLCVDQLTLFCEITSHCANEAIKTQRIAALKRIITSLEAKEKTRPTIVKAIACVIEALATLKKPTSDTEDAFWLQEISHTYLRVLDNDTQEKLGGLLPERCKDDLYAHAYWLHRHGNAKTFDRSSNFFAQVIYLQDESSIRYGDDIHYNGRDEGRYQDERGNYQPVILNFDTQFLHNHQESKYSDLSKAYSYRKKSIHLSAIEYFKKALEQQPELSHIIHNEIAICYDAALYSAVIRGEKSDDEISAYCNDYIEHLQKIHRAILSPPRTLSKQLISQKLAEHLVSCKSAIDNSKLPMRLLNPLKRKYNFALGKYYLDEITASPFKKDISTLIAFSKKAIDIYKLLVETTSRDKIEELATAERGRDEAIYQLALILKDSPEKVIETLEETHANTVSNRQGHKFCEFQLLLAKAYMSLTTPGNKDKDYNLQQALKYYDNVTNGPPNQHENILKEAVGFLMPYYESQLAKLKQELSAKPAIPTGADESIISLNKLIRDIAAKLQRYKNIIPSAPELDDKHQEGSLEHTPPSAYAPGTAPVMSTPVNPAAAPMATPSETSSNPLPNTQVALAAIIAKPTPQAVATVSVVIAAEAKQDTSAPITDSSSDKLLLATRGDAIVDVPREGAPPPVAPQPLPSDSFLSKGLRELTPPVPLPASAATASASTASVPSRGEQTSADTDSTKKQTHAKKLMLAP